MATCVVSLVSRAAARSLLSLESEDVQTAHRHPMTGTPCDVPVPVR